VNLEDSLINGSEVVEVTSWLIYGEESLPAAQCRHDN